MRGIVLILFLYWYGFHVSEASDECTHHVAVGENVTLQLEYKISNQDYDVDWRNKTHKLYQWKKMKKPTNINSDGSLTLTDLKMADSATYSVEVFKKDGTQVTTEQKRLCVLEKISSKPQILSDCKLPKVTLTCSVEKPADVKYVWNKNQKPWTKNTNTLTEDLKTLTSRDTFSCNVSNEVSYQMSDDITIKCHGMTGDKLFGLDFWVMLTILATAGGLILILVLVVVICLCKRHKHIRDREREEEELRLAHMMEQAHPPRSQEAPKGRAAPGTHPQTGEDYTPPPPRPRGKRPRPPPVPVEDEEKPPPRPKPRRSAPRHNHT